MKMHKALAGTLVLALLGCRSASIKQDVTTMSNTDPYLWLEEVESEKALQFAKAENEKTLGHYKALPIFNELEKDLRAIITAQDRLPAVSIEGTSLYNFWQDSKHTRGVWRRVPVEGFKAANPEWEVLLDVDALAKAENENWVWKGASMLPPDNERAFIYLSRGGKDAAVVREYDLVKKQFVKNGFHLPEAKSFLKWIDKDTVYVGTDFGPGSLTTSGYTRMTKRWKRGTPLSEASLILAAEETDMSCYSYVMFTQDGRYRFHSIRKSFYESKDWYEDSFGTLTLIPMPLDSEFQGIFKEQLIYQLKSDFNGYKTGSIVSIALSDIGDSEKAYKNMKLIFVPTDKKFVQYVSATKSYLILHVIDNILSRIEKSQLNDKNQWVSTSVPLGDVGMASVASSDDNTDLYLAQYVDFLTPTSLYVGDASDPKNGFLLLKQAPARFDSSDMKVQRFSAKSKDGTMIPYFVISEKDLALDGKNPTLLYGYGGFQSSMQPTYLSLPGKAWISRGGVYVMSNLRGGGEFGPAWHQAVLKENRYKVYEDNIAIAEDLIARKITSPAHLGISGRSNGGLLTGATITLRPDLFNAVIIGVPLLDMVRYHKLLAGASWMAEYGDPEDPEMLKAILQYSPYQKVSPSVKYPEPLIMTSTKDDRVHPGHARKMVAKMKEQGHPVRYYENMEGGHAGSSNLEQSILWNTLEYTYLWEKLGNKKGKY